MWTVFPSDFQVDLPDPCPGDKRVGEKESEEGTMREDEGGLAGEKNRPEKERKVGIKLTNVAPQRAR